MNIEHYREQGPVQSPAKSMVIMLHGVGANGKDLISLAPLYLQSVQDAVFISPDAPFACDMTPGYPNSFQWFSLQTRTHADLLRGVETITPILEKFIDEQLQKHGIGYDKLVLMGFSQGTMTALHVAPRLKEKIAGVLGYSGMLLEENPADVKHTMPVHLIHGIDDEVVSVESWGTAKNILNKQGFEFSGHSTQGLGHSIDLQGAESGAAFMKKVLS